MIAVDWPWARRRERLQALEDRRAEAMRRIDAVRGRLERVTRRSVGFRLTDAERAIRQGAEHGIEILRRARERKEDG